MHPENSKINWLCTYSINKPLLAAEAKRKRMLKTHQLLTIPEILGTITSFVHCLWNALFIGGNP